MNIYKLQSGKYVAQQNIMSAYEILTGKIETDINVLREWLSTSNPIVETYSEATVDLRALANSNRVLATQAFRELYGTTLVEANNATRAMLDEPF